jgi:hypothetical protein
MLTLKGLEGCRLSQGLTDWKGNSDLQLSINSKIGKELHYCFSVLLHSAPGINEYSNDSVVILTKLSIYGFIGILGWNLLFV